MKEIDFLPIWYKDNRRRQIGYHTQYAGIGGIFLAMVIWSFIAMRSLSEAGAELALGELKSTVAERAVREFAAVKDEAARLQGKARTIKEIDSKIDVANILAEISYLADRRIAFSKVEFVAEKFGDKNEEKSNSGTTVKAVVGKFSGKEALPLGDVIFKVLINGIASDTSDIATLICKLEDSPYFCQVIPLFVRDREMKTSANAEGEEFQVSEFEIRCNLANYRQEESCFAKGEPKGKAAGL